MNVLVIHVCENLHEQLINLLFLPTQHSREQSHHNTPSSHLQISLIPSSNPFMVRAFRPRADRPFDLHLFDVNKSHLFHHCFKAARDCDINTTFLQEGLCDEVVCFQEWRSFQSPIDRTEWCTCI